LKLALIGDPVAHSRGPGIQNAILREAGLDGSYVALRVPAGHCAETVRRLRAEKFDGINVTTPLKEEALAVCDELDEEAQLAEAVNTLFLGRAVIATNTDGIGARSALETILGQPVALERIGILGTGPTARAILAQFRETDVYAFVWGRDEAKVMRLRERLEADLWPDNAPEIVISTLPPNIDLPERLLRDLRGADIVMDTNYGERSTLEALVGREVIKGDLMLEAQARASFDFWLAHAQGILEPPA